MPAAPARTEIADTYPNPSNAVARTGFGKLWDFLTGLLGTSGTAADARVLLGIGPVISFRNLLINANGAINQRAYVSGVATTGANQYTLDRWRVVTSGQNVSFTAAAPDRTITCPAGGLEQVIEGSMIVGGVYTLAWGGTATATVNGVAITSGANTAALPANTNATVRFTGGTLLNPQFELGTVATPFERRPVSYEETLCKRYYQQIYFGVRFIATGSGQPSSAQFNFSISMRAVPTMSTFTAPSVANSSGATYTNPTVRGFRLDSVSGAAGDAFLLDGVVAASAEL